MRRIWEESNTGDELCLAAAMERKEREFDGSVASTQRPSGTHFANFFRTRPSVPYTSLFRLIPLLTSLQKTFFPRQQIPSHRLWAGLFFCAMDEFDPGQGLDAPALARTRQLYLVGGGYLTDLFPDRSHPGTHSIRTAIKKIPVATAPIGIGPFQSPLYEEQATSVLRQIKLTVRDKPPDFAVLAN